MHRFAAVHVVLSGLALLAGGTACEPFYYCDAAPSDRIARAPQTLAATGLFEDVAARVLAPGVRAFRPEFELWSDGALKQRWVWLPPGGTIDTRDMDDWRFPTGTKLWKEFRAGDVPVETRLLEKVGDGDGDWLALAYLWKPDGSDAVAVPHGAIDARGSSLDVPAAGECAACHGGRRAHVLGFSALQLAHEPREGELDLAALADEGRLSHPPSQTFRVPGNATERAALGYLHANCGHCHNSARPERHGARCFDPENEFEFWLRTERLDSPQQTPTYQSAVGSVIVPGNPGGSRLIELVSSRKTFEQMPPLATEIVDVNAVQTLSQWIRELEAP